MIHMLRAPVSVYMTLDPDAVPEDTSLETVANKLGQRGISAMPVVNTAGRSVGVISRHDLLRVGRLDFPEGQTELEWKLPDLRAHQVMTTHLLCVSPSTSVAEAAALMLDHHVHRVFVDDGHGLRGVLTTRDVMKALIDARIATPISSFASKPVHSIGTHEPIGAAQMRLEELKIRGLVVLYEGTPVGIFAEPEALAARHRDPLTPVEQAMGHEVLVLPPDTPCYQAASQMASTRARRIVLVDQTDLVGVLTGFDLAAAAAIT